MKKILSVLVCLLFIFNSTSSFAETTKVSMSYLYFGSSNIHIQLVDQTNGAIDTVSPNYFDIKPDGTLKITEKFNQTFVQEMKKRNVAIIPFISNHWDREVGRKGLENRIQLASEVANFINRHDLDGVNVDLEGLTELDREDLTDFVKQLRQKLPRDKIVSVAVAANPYGYSKGWHGSYDYVNLAKYADYLILMTYDESWPGSAPGAVASKPFVEKSIQYAIKKGIEPSKLVLGLPFYGRIWRLEDIPFTSTSVSNRIIGNGISLSKVIPMLDRLNARLEYDEALESPVAYFNITEDNDPIYLYDWSKDPLPKGQYVLWYENNTSLKSKVELVHKYGLKGVGSWSLGQEHVTLWKNYDLWLKQLDFKDVPFDFWASSDIAKVKDAGWMIGRTDIFFHPNSQLKRSEAAVILVRFLGLKQIPNSDSPFMDISNHWAEVEINIAHQHTLMVGREEAMFSPDALITREEMAVILSRIFGSANAQEEILLQTTFSDVNNTTWSFKSIEMMANQGVFGGFEDGTFRPKHAITRAQMAALLNRVSSHKE